MPIKLLALLWIFFFSNLSHADQLSRDVLHNSILAWQNGRYEDSLRHWFLYQSLDKEAKAAEIEQPLLSLMWASVDRLDFCPETLPKDEPGQGLWYLAVYNYVARHSKARAGKHLEESDALQTFEKGYRLRTVTYNDPLSFEEMLSFRAQRDDCGIIAQLSFKPRWWFLQTDIRMTPENRAKWLLLLIHQIEQKTKITGGKDWLRMRKLALQLFLSESKDEITSESVALIVSLYTADGAFLKQLEPDLRLYLFQLAQKLDNEQLSAEQKSKLLLRWLDLACELEESTLLDQVLAAIVAFDPEHKLHIWRHERGMRLLQLTDKDVFSEGLSIAMVRALEAYDAGDHMEALKMLSLASKYAPKARAQEGAQLARDWIKHILIEHRFDGRILEFLHSYVPKAEMKSMMLDLVWTSALMGEPQVLRLDFYADDLSPRVRELHSYLSSIALRNFGKFQELFKRGLKEDPRRTVNFAQELVERVKLEPYPVLHALVPLLSLIQNSLELGLREKILRGETPHKTLDILDSLLQNSLKQSAAQGDRNLARQIPLGLGAIRVPPSRIVPWEFPEIALVLIDVFQEIPIRLHHTHHESEVEMQWELKRP